MSRFAFLSGLVSVLFGIFCGSIKAQQEGDDSAFVKDVTYPDGTKVKPGQELKKEWEVKNTGSVTWEDRYLKAVKSSAGEEDLKNSKLTSIPTTPPGKSCVLKATLRAPTEKGTYKVTFKMVDKQGKEFFPKKQGVFIEVVVE